jgi:hypothetical protein
MNETSIKVIDACKANANVQGKVCNAFAALLQQTANTGDGSNLAKAQLNFVTAMADFTGVPPTILADEMLGPDYLDMMVSVMHEVARELHLDVGVFFVTVE